MEKYSRFDLSTYQTSSPVSPACPDMQYDYINKLNTFESSANGESVLTLSSDSATSPSNQPSFRQLLIEGPWRLKEGSRGKVTLKKSSRRESSLHSEIFLICPVRSSFYYAIFELLSSFTLTTGFSFSCYQAFFYVFFVLFL